jgi:hypothetical protein
MRYALIGLVAMSLSACKYLSTDARQGYEEGIGWTTASSYTTADVRIVTQRTHPVLGNTVICTEPSPDVAKAISSAVALTGQGGNGPASGSLGAAGSAAEAVAELAGRSTALLGLRDGLYRACEAYANGVIGQDAYALVLSRYGQLMTTLFLGQDITGAAGAEGKASIASAAVQALANQQGSSAGQTTTTTTASPNKTSAKGSNMGAPKLMLAAARAMIPGVDGGVEPKVLLAATPPAATPPAAAPPAATPPAAAPPAAAPSPTAVGVSGTSALALTRMNEDYFNLDIDSIHVLLVACINENDPTRFHGPLNEWLKRICSPLALTELENLETTAFRAISSTPYFRPVNPEAAVQPSAAPAAKQTGTKAGTTVGKFAKKVPPAPVAPTPPGAPAPLVPPAPSAPSPVAPSAPEKRT